MHERSSGGVGTAHSTCKLPSNIPYSVALLDAQGGAVPPMPTQEQAPQIRHLAAEKSGQFRVRALGRCKGLRERADQVTHGLIYGAIFNASPFHGASPCGRIFQHSPGCKIA